jgi:hypothetical protein
MKIDRLSTNTSETEYEQTLDKQDILVGNEQLKISNKNCLLQKKKLRSEDGDDEYDDEKFNSGKWSLKEHLQFILGIIKNGNDWKETQCFVRTRSCPQARSHAQKFFAKLLKSRKDGIARKFSNVLTFKEECPTMEENQFRKLLVILSETHLGYKITSDEDLSDIENIVKIICSKNKNICKKPENDSYNPSNQHLNILSFLNFCNTSKWECKNSPIKHITLTNKIGRIDFKKSKGKITFYMKYYFSRVIQ